MNDPSFVHLHVHSEFSLSDGLLKVKQLVNKAQALNMPAIALTDVNNLFALVKFYSACRDAGIKPIIGAELKLYHEDDPAPGRIVALAATNQGYKNLIELVSHAYVGSPHRHAIMWEELQSHQEGLIILSGGIGGHLWHAASSAVGGGDRDLVKRRMATIQSTFGDRYYIELTRTDRPQ